MQFAAFCTFRYKVFFHPMPSVVNYGFCGHWQSRMAVVQEKAVCCVRNSEWCGIDIFSHNPDEQFCWKRQSYVPCGISDSIVDTLMQCVCQESSCKINYRIRGFLWHRRGVMWTESLRRNSVWCDCSAYFTPRRPCIKLHMNWTYLL